QGGFNSVRAAKRLANRVGRQQLVADPPGKVALDAGRAVVVTVGMVRQPIVRECTGSAVRERKQRDQKPAGRHLPSIDRPIAATADDHAAVSRKDNRLRSLKMSSQLA